MSQAEQLHVEPEGSPGGQTREEVLEYVHRDRNAVRLSNTELDAVVWRVGQWLEVRCRHDPRFVELLESASPEEIVKQLVEDLQCSALLPRMLMRGRDPLREPPPLVHGVPAYSQADPALCPRCGAERSEPGWAMRVDYAGGDTATVAVCVAEWHPGVSLRNVQGSIPPKPAELAW